MTITPLPGSTGPPTVQGTRPRAAALRRGLERSSKRSTTRNVAAGNLTSCTPQNTRGGAGFRACAPGDDHHGRARARWSQDRVGTAQRSRAATASGRAAKRAGEVRQGRHSQERRSQHAGELHPAKHARRCGFPTQPLPNLVHRNSAHPDEVTIVLPVHTAPEQRRRHRAEPRGAPRRRAERQPASHGPIARAEPASAVPLPPPTTMDASITIRRPTP